MQVLHLMLYYNNRHGCKILEHLYYLEFERIHVLFTISANKGRLHEPYLKI